RIVSRHFGESFFLAAYLFAEGRLPGANVVDLGSGAGFPGIPLKIYAPSLHVTLVESNRKKAISLREVVRALQLSDVEVLAGWADPVLIPQSSQRVILVGEYQGG